MKKKIIVTGQDFGLSKSVNTGLIYAINHKENVISELALVPNAPGSMEAAKLARDLDISVSLNMNFTGFRPLSENIKTLTDGSGSFYKPNLWDWDFSFIDKFDDSEISQEIDAQWNWFVENVGRKPSAILTRKNEYGDPKFLIPITEKALQEGIAVRSPVWKWKENYGAQSFVTQQGITKMTDSIFLSSPDWNGRWGYDLLDDIDKLIEDIQKTDGVSEVVIFAGFVDSELMKLSILNWQRGKYLDILERKPEILRKIRESFEIIGYRDL